jgi:hypothetical protein
MMRFGGFAAFVIPAKAGIQGNGRSRQVWIPAYAGMTLARARSAPSQDDAL